MYPRPTIVGKMDVFHTLAHKNSIKYMVDTCEYLCVHLLTSIIITHALQHAQTNLSLMYMLLTCIGHQFFLTWHGY